MRVANLKAAHSATLASIANKTAAAHQAVLTYTNTVNAAFTRIQEDTNERIANIQQEAASASAEQLAYIERLRKLANSSRSGTGTNTSVASERTSEQDQETFDMFIQLLDWHSRTLAEVGAYADTLEAVGLSCEAHADAISHSFTPE